MVASGSSKDTPICLDDSDDEQPQQVKGKAKAVVAPAPLALDLRALNQEREARQAKRMREAEASGSGSHEQGPSQRTRLSQDAGAASPAWTSQPSLGSAVSPFTATDRFWDGIVRRSWNRHVGTGLKFEEMLLPSTRHDKAGMQHALLINYSTDPVWLSNFFHAGLPVTFVGRHVDQETRTIKRGSRSEEGFGKSWNVIRPAWPGQQGAQHIKMLALFYPDRMRLCVLTGNMWPVDWLDVENVAYIQDFHRLPAGNINTSSDAYTQLSTMLSSLGLTQTLDQSFADLKHYDLSTFGGESGARLVVSVPCNYRKSVLGWNAIEKLGLGRLKRVVDDMDVQPVKGGLEISAQTSSLSSGTKRRWLHQFHIIGSGLSRGIVPIGKGKNWKVPLDTALQHTASSSSTPTFPPPDWPPVRILYPTDAQANRSLGEGSRGSFPGNQSQVDGGGYRDLLHQPVSERSDRLLMHAKIILALPPGKRFDSGGGRRLDEPEQKHEKTKGKTKVEKPIGWLYMGSHNFTIAAWGQLSGTPAEPRLSSVTNHELGIVFPIRNADLNVGTKSLARDALIFNIPAAPYRSHDEILDNVAAAREFEKQMAGG